MFASTGIDTQKLPTPMVTQPSISWVALTAPAVLRYNGTTVQEVHKALVNAFGQFPIKLNAGDHLPVLFGMRCAAGDGGTPYEILRAALERFGEIELRDQ